MLWIGFNAEFLQRFLEAIGCAGKPKPWTKPRVLKREEQTGVRCANRDTWPICHVEVLHLIIIMPGHERLWQKLDGDQPSASRTAISSSNNIREVAQQLVCLLRFDSARLFP